MGVSSLHGRGSKVREAGWWVAGAVGLVIVAAIFVAYQQPVLLLEFFNLRYCG